MIEDRRLPELRVYKQLERSLPLRQEPELGRLVVASDNEEIPIHRWFRFKEGFSGHLVSRVLSAYFPDKERVSLLDPFCGMGTTLLSAQTVRGWNVDTIGIEYNPFIRFAAATKLSWPSIDVREFTNIAERVIDAPPAPSSLIPELSGFATGRCMSHHIARRLIGIREAICRDGQSTNHMALLLGVAATIEPLSRTRKDGRALRLIERERQLAGPLIKQKWRLMAEDVKALQNSCRSPNLTRIIPGDGRSLLSSSVKSHSIDLVLTSPPYMNNIDYSEVYKLELWLMDFIRDVSSFLRLRKGTLRSHPTSELSNEETQFLRFVAQDPLRRSFDPILEKLDTEKEKWRRKLFTAYFADITATLKQQFLVLRKGGIAVIVVGNSLHGGRYAPYVIATDLLICELARVLGFNVDKISVARALRRRLTGNHFLRESVIVLRKPNGS